MKKAAILTIVSDNYGNRLQNYALQKVLQGLGVEVETLRLTKVKKLAAFLKDLVRPLVKRDKYLAFARFNKRINWSHCSVCRDELTDAIEKYYDYFVIGSDQVWNVTFDFVSEYDFLPTVPKGKKLAYSASFGIQEIPFEQQAWVKKGLEEIASLSVREESGAEIIRKLTGREALVLIDPTMLLDAETWMEIAKAPKMVREGKPYLLTYFLGGRSERADGDIQRYAREHGLEVYHLLDLTEPVGPSEFVYLISRAKLVMTDSFHACVFSFLFQKPFLVYEREGSESSMMSRLDTLLGKFHLERKYVGSGLENELFECDYEEGFRQLALEREKALDFLKRSMKLD